MKIDKSVLEGKKRIEIKIGDVVKCRGYLYMIVLDDDTDKYRLLRLLDGDETYIFNEEDYLKAYGFDLTFDVGYIQYYYDPVAYFFIFDEAKKYMEYQGHNLREPRIDCVGAGYANYGDYHHFYELLMNMGMQLKEGEVVEEANN